MIKQSMRYALAVALAISNFAFAADVTVSAAVSLQQAFTEIGKEYEKANAGSKVLFNFGASGQLVQQIARGAPADVLATADLDTMERASKQNLIVFDTRSNFVSNALVIVVPAASNVSVGSIRDLAKPEIERIGIGTPESVPAGRYAKEALELAGQWDALKSKCVFGQNVRQVLDYVARKEIDAGFVYATDALLMKDKVKVVAQAPLRNPVLYPIGAVKGSGNERGARRFIDFVKSDTGQAILARYGFGKP